MKKLKLGEQIIDPTKIDKENDKLMVSNVAKYLGFDGSTITTNIGLYKIGTLISYNLDKPKINKNRPGYGGFEFRMPPNPVFERRGILEQIDANVRSTRRRGDTPGLRRIPTSARPNTPANSFLDLDRLRREEDIIINDINSLDREINHIDSNLGLRLYLTETHIQQARATRSSHLVALQNAQSRLINVRARIEAQSVPIVDEEREVEAVSDPFSATELVSTDTFTTNWNDAFIEELKSYSLGDSVKEEETKELSYKEKRKQAFVNFKNNFGGCPTIIKGYLIRDKVYTSNEEIISSIEVTPNSKSYSTIIKVYYLDSKDELRTKVLTIKNLIAPCIYKNILYIIPYLFKLKIKSFEDSANIFGPTKDMKALEGEYIDIHGTSGYSWEITTHKLKRLGKTTQGVTLTREEDNKKTKFLFNDCEFINSKISSYTVPLDKTITTNSVVKIIDKKLSKYGVSICNEAIVVSTKSNPSSKVISKQCRNHRMDIITLKLLKGDRIITVHAQDLKLIKQNKTNDNKTNNKEEDWTYRYFQSGNGINAFNTFINQTTQGFTVTTPDF